MKFLSQPQLWQERVLRLGSLTRVRGALQMGQGVGWLGSWGFMAGFLGMWGGGGVGFWLEESVVW